MRFLTKIIKLSVKIIQLDFQTIIFLRTLHNVFMKMMLQWRIIARLLTQFKVRFQKLLNMSVANQGNSSKLLKCRKKITQTTLKVSI